VPCAVPELWCWPTTLDADIVRRGLTTGVKFLVSKGLYDTVNVLLSRFTQHPSLSKRLLARTSRGFLCLERLLRARRCAAQVQLSLKQQAAASSPQQALRHAQRVPQRLAAWALW